MGELIDRIRSSLADRYEIEREIGRGGMAVVLLARDLQLARQVAIKVIRPELAQAVGIERFLREVRIEAALDHPNIVALYDSGEADGLPYYVMPYVEGESLRRRLERETRLSLDEVCRVARCVADGLAYAHGRGIVHKDIKPENILLSDERVLIADFGIAKATAEAGGELLTTYGVVLGTPEYMSPEQATGEKVDTRSDIYALGCVLYEMLSGDPPFTGKTRSGIIARHIQEPVPPLEVVRVDTPIGVVEAVEKALAKVPGDRFAVATELVDAIESERTTGAQTRRRSRVRKRMLGWGAAALALAATVVGWMLVAPDSAVLDRNRVVVFPLVTVDDASNVGVGWDVALAVGQVFEVSAGRVRAGRARRNGFRSSPTGGVSAVPTSESDGATKCSQGAWSPSEGSRISRSPRETRMGRQCGRGVGPIELRFTLLRPPPFSQHPPRVPTNHLLHLCGAEPILLHHVDHIRYATVVL